MVREMRIDLEINAFYALLGKPFIDYHIEDFKQRTLGIVLLTPEKLEHMPKVGILLINSYVLVLFCTCSPNMYVSASHDF